MIDGGDPLTKMLGSIVKRNEDLEKRVARLETLEFAALGGGGWYEVGTITAPAAGLTSFKWTGIPQTFLHLVLIISARRKECCGTAPIYLRFNNDAAASYFGRLTSIDLAGASNSVNAGGTSLLLGYCPDQSFAGIPWYETAFTGGHAWIPDYRCYIDRQRFVISDMFAWLPDQEELPADEWRHMGYGRWSNVAASISTVEVFSSAVLAKNSKVSLYAIDGTYECNT